MRSKIRKGKSRNKYSRNNQRNKSRKRKEPLHRHFKNKSDYRKATAYIKMHGIKTRNVGYVYIDGKKHKVK